MTRRRRKGKGRENIESLGEPKGSRSKGRSRMGFVSKLTNAPQPQDRWSLAPFPDKQMTNELCESCGGEGNHGSCDEEGGLPYTCHRCGGTGKEPPIAKLDDDKNSPAFWLWPVMLLA